MSQSLARVVVHLVFSTKNRVPFIRTEHRERMFAYLAGTLNAIQCPVVVVGGMPDHVHLLFGLARTLSLSKVAEEVKIESSKWAKDVVHPEFYWQAGYAAFSVSATNVDHVASYVRNQEGHHATRDFQTEYRQLLHLHGLELDERYAWD